CLNWNKTHYAIAFHSFLKINKVNITTNNFLETMKISSSNHRHGCSTATNRAEEDELGAHKFIPITASSVGRRHLSMKNSRKSEQPYTMNQSLGDCSTWYHQEKKVRPEPGGRTFPPFSLLFSQGDETGEETTEKVRGNQRRRRNLQDRNSRDGPPKRI
ncbi:MAG: hypothetical protein ACREBR_03185, partial [bacterium]